jgi:hypothetical protein
MKTIDILPEGIRRVSGEQEAGAASCDNMLNLRYEYNALKVVGNKEQVYTDVIYEQIYEHKVGNRTNIIVVYKKSDTEYVIYDKTNNKKIYDFTPIEDIDITFINNLMVVKMTEAEVNGGYRIMTFIWRDDKYSLFYNGELPETPDFSVSIENNLDSGGNNTGEMYTISNVEILNSFDFVDYAKSMYNKLRLHGGEYTQGVFMVCVNYTLFDGSHTRPSAPRMVIAGDYTHTIPQTSDFQSVTDKFYLRYYGDTSATRRLQMSISSAKVKFSLNIDDEFYQNNKDIIKAVNIYSTRSIPLFDLEQLANGTYSTDIDNWFKNNASDDEWRALEIYPNANPANNSSTVLGYEFPIEYKMPEDFSKEMFYLQKSIPLVANTSFMNEEFYFKVGDDILASQLMNVDASGYFRYYGDMLSYNNRLHLYNLKRRFYLDGSRLKWGVNPTMEYTSNVYIKTETEDLVYNFTFYSDYQPKSGEFMISQFISFPDSRAYKAEIFCTISSQNYKATLNLIPSATQNFAYAIIKDGVLNMSQTSDTLPNKSSLEYSDSDVMVVSAQSNPAYYDNSNSYRVGGNITSICPITDSVSDLQVGQFPIAIFTDNGIYAISQGVSTGSSQILYSNTSKISEVVSVSKAIQTKTGVYFMADGGVYNLSGRIAQRISSLVEGEPDKDIYQNPSYKLICNNEQVYNIENLPSLKNYCGRYAVLAYDDIQDELFVSDGSQSTQHAISFVYNVKTKNWHSVDFSILFAKNKYVIIKNYLRGSRNTVVNINNETLVDNTNKAQVVHLQTRALTFGSYSYKTLQRAIARCDITTNKQGENGMLGLYIFGSNDIKSWYLIGASQFHNGYTDKLQIQKIANNYKYFIFIIGGYVNKDSVLNRIEVMFNDKYNNKLR